MLNAVFHLLLMVQEGKEAVGLNVTTVTLHSCSEREPGSLEVRNAFSFSFSLS